MKRFYSIIACAAIATSVFYVDAQVRWNPTQWQVVDGGNTRLVENDKMEVVVTPQTSKDHCHIYNATDLTFTADEPYLIIHFEATPGLRGNKANAVFKFYNDFEGYNNLTTEQIDGYNGYVFDQTFNVDKGDGFVVYRGKYDDADDDIFTNGWNYDSPVGRGNIWVIDLRQVPTKNGGYIFGKEDVQTFSITHTRAPWWTAVADAPARMKSALQIEICANAIPTGEDKTTYLADKSVQYRYIATASAYDILKDNDIATRANDANIDPAKLNKLIDDYRTKAETSGVYAESRDINTGIKELNAAASRNFSVIGNVVSCDGAVSMELFGMNGCRVAAVSGDCVEAQSGLYIVRAIAADGQVFTGKIIIK